MSLIYKIDDFLLSVEDNSEKALSIVHKYDAFLEALTTDSFKHLREATRQAIKFFVTNKFQTTEQAAISNYEKSQRLKTKYESLELYLQQFRIKDQKSCSIDLATGTGKSWVIYAVAQIMLGEGLVDKVLVLCPSLTIEEELKKKFDKFSGNQTYTKILMELNALYPSPAIKSANDPILNGDICVENIHAAYERTGSSVQDSFKGKGQRTLVINDEAHHIYSEADANVKKWYEFLTNPEYGFYYVLGVTGTPYIGDDYFHDVIYRYSLRQAMDDGIVKRIDYKTEEEYQKDKGFSETYANHKSIQKKYSNALKPITIIVTDKIIRCVEVWDELVKFLAVKEKMPYEQAARKAIWVTSGIPSNQSEKERIQAIFKKPEKTRKENIAKLRTVDDLSNEIEWIVSVSMLTEGWDVKNVFQIVPHEQRAFNSKLLISQVLGRGLRIPDGLKQPIYVKINNHEKWTSQIENLYKEILEIENRISWKYDERRSQYLFPLYNITYESYQETIETKEKPAKDPDIVKLMPQEKKRQTYSKYSVTGTFTFDIERKDIVPIEQAAREVKLFLKSKDERISGKWPLKKIQKFIETSLKDAGQETTYISFENLAKIKQAFGPMFRETGKPVPRMKLRPDTLYELHIDAMPEQSFNESAIKNDGYLFYSEHTITSLTAEHQKILKEHLDKKQNYEQYKKMLEDLGQSTNDIEYLNKNLFEINEQGFKTPLNMVHVSYNPEYRFTTSLFQNGDLIDSFIKSPDKGFYNFPYSYKPSELGSTHVKRENCNPDFFLKKKNKNHILVVEMKDDRDIEQENKAKYRDGKEHFEALNIKLQENNLDWEYFFYFLSPEDISSFFQAIRENRYQTWNSRLMQELS